MPPQIISAIHRRFPKVFTPAVNAQLSSALAPPPRVVGAASGVQSGTASSATGTSASAAAAALSVEQREKEETARVARQRPVLRVCAELALVGIIKDAANRSGGEWMMKTLKDLVSKSVRLSLNHTS